MTAVVTADPMDVRANLIDAVCWGRRQADTAKDRKIEEIVAHERDLVVGQMLRCQDFRVARALVRFALDHDRDSQLGGTPLCRL